MSRLTLTIEANRIEIGRAGRVAAAEFSAPLGEDELAELAWYLETDVSGLFGLDRDRATDVARAIPEFGAKLARCLTPTEEMSAIAAEAVDAAREEAVPVSIAAVDPFVLALPWELARFDTARGSSLLAEFGEIVRHPGGAGTAAPRPSGGPRSGPLRILMVSPRPRRQEDVSVMPTLGSTVAASVAYPDDIELKVVRPATVRAFADALRGETYDVVHFDGHGVAGADGEVELWFEHDDGEPTTVSGPRFAQLVAPASPAVVVLNACRSSFVSEPGASPMAGAIASALPGSEVVAMRFAVTVRAVEALLDGFYPTLLESGVAGAAVAEARRALLEAWEPVGGGMGPPDFVNFQVLSATMREPAFEQRRGLRRVGGEEPASIGQWLETLREIESAALRSEKPIVLTGCVGSGKSTVARAFASYAAVTGLYDSVTLSDELPADGETAEPGPAAEPDAARPRRRLLVVDPVEAAASAPADTAPPEQPAGARLLVCLRYAPEWPDVERVPLAAPPIPVVSVAVRSLVERHPDMSESEGLDFIYLGGSHLGTLAAMVADRSRAPQETIDDLQWGVEPSPHACATRTQALLDQLDTEDLKMASILGLLSGWLFPTQLSIFAAGGLREGSFERIYGRSVDLDEWTALLERLWRAGLIGVADADAGLPRVEVPPIVSRCLRVHLRRVVDGDLPLQELQRDIIRASSGFALEVSKTFDQPDVSSWRSYELKSHVLALLEPTLRRGMQFAARVGDDRLAANVALLYFHSSPDGNELFRLGLDLVASLGLDAAAAKRDFPRLSGVVYEARAAQASGREEWAGALRYVEAALATHRDDRPSAFTGTTLRVIGARACWRLSRREDAERLLAEAAERAEAGELFLVASACDDMAQYLHLDRREGLTLRARVGVGAGPASAQGQAYEAESLGQGDRAQAYWLEEMRRAELTRDDIGAALARTELGRACAMDEKPEEARAWLKGALEQRRRLGLAVAAPLYYLAMAAELEDDLDAAEAWLRDANEAAAAESDTSPTLRGDCIYQLGIVLFKRENRKAARDAWTAALGIYEDLDLPDYAGDTHLGLAQLEAAEHDREAAERHLCAAREAFDGDRVRLAMLEEVERQLRA